jgi:hypothetical protein
MIRTDYNNLDRPSNQNPLDDIPRHLLMPPVVKPSRSCFRVSGQVLHILQRHALVQQIGDRPHQCVTGAIVFESLTDGEQNDKRRLAPPALDWGYIKGIISP